MAPRKNVGTPKAAKSKAAPPTSPAAKAKQANRKRVQSTPPTPKSDKAPRLSAEQEKDTCIPAEAKGTFVTKAGVDKFFSQCRTPATSSDNIPTQHKAPIAKPQPTQEPHDMGTFVTKDGMEKFFSQCRKEPASIAITQPTQDTKPEDTTPHTSTYQDVPSGNMVTQAQDMHMGEGAQGAPHKDASVPPEEVVDVPAEAADAVDEQCSPRDTNEGEGEAPDAIPCLDDAPQSSQSKCESDLAHLATAKGGGLTAHEAIAADAETELDPDLNRENVHVQNNKPDTSEIESADVLNNTRRERMTSLHKLMQWPKTVLNRMWGSHIAAEMGADESCDTSLRLAKRRGRFLEHMRTCATTLRMSTAFSGIDTPSTSLQCIALAASDELGLDVGEEPHFANVYAIEWYSKSQRELQAAPISPTCIFGNISDFWHAEMGPKVNTMLESGQFVTVMQRLMKNLPITSIVQNKAFCVKCQGRCEVMSLLSICDSVISVLLMKLCGCVRYCATLHGLWTVMSVNVLRASGCVRLCHVRVCSASNIYHDSP